MEAIKQDIKIEKLKGSENYQPWSQHMKGILKASGLWKFVNDDEGGRPQDRPRIPAAAEDGSNSVERRESRKDQEEFDAREAKAAYYIYNNVSDAIRNTLDNDQYDGARQRWVYLQRYKQTGYIETYNAMHQFLSLTTEGCRDVEDFCIKFETYANKLDALTGSNKAKHMSQPAKVVHFLQNISDLSSMDTWASRKRSEFQALADPDSVDLNKLLSEAIEESRVAKSKKDHKREHKSDSAGLAIDTSKNGKGNKGQQTNANNGRRCYTCESDKHLKGDCPYYKPENAAPNWVPKKQVGKFTDADLSKGNIFRKSSGSGSASKRGSDAKSIATYVDTVDESDAKSVADTHLHQTKAYIGNATTMFVAADLVEAQADAYVAANRQKDWLVDSGASDHMGNDLNDFVEVRPCRVRVHTAKGSTIVTKRGIIMIKARRRDGVEVSVKLQNVLFMPTLFVNLLSSHRMAENGLSVHTAENEIVWKGSNQHVLALRDTGKHWILDSKQDVNASALATTSETWHARFGHASYDYIQKTAKQVTGIDDKVVKPDHHCGACAQGKAVNHDGRTPQARQEHFCDEFHLDLVGPITPEASDDSNTALNMTDDATRARYTRIFRGKGGETVLNAFKEFEILLRTQLDLTIKGIRIDGGKEFYNLVDYCVSKGMRVTYSPPYDPAKHGVAERTNGIVHNMVRSMLIGGKVPQQYWDEAYRAAIHILNRPSD